MPMHDWICVPDAIFHAFHHYWVSAISDVLNRRSLPPDYYALAEPAFCEFGSDAITIESTSDAEFYSRKKSSVVIHHGSDDRIAATIDIVSPGNKLTQTAFRAVVQKAREHLESRIHLLIIDPYPPGMHNRKAIHSAIWKEVAGVGHEMPVGKRLTLVAYECASPTTRAYLESVAVGDCLPDMPLFLAPAMYVQVALESTYQAAFAVLPQRWRKVLETASS